VVKVIVEKLQDLGVVLDANGVVLCTYFDGSKDVLHWIVSPDFSMTGSYLLPYFDHPIFNQAWQSKENRDEYFSKAFSVEEKNSFFEYAFEHSDYKYFPEDFKKWVFQNDKHILSFAWQTNSAILIPSHTGMVPNEAEKAILIRFARVFEQAYVRFMDLQKSEEQAREAIKQASVDRIRAEIASMRTTNDLERIQPLIWNELTTLGVPFTRCGVFILDEEHEQVETFLSTPEGKSIASFTSGYSDVAVISEALPYWRNKEIYKAHWDEATFLAQAQILLSQGNITSTETYLTGHHSKDLYLHFLPFLQGILYVGNEAPLSDAELQLVQNLADAFSIAYARYEDFNKLELAKQQIENTLVDLKQTQAQLVQSEKMASLGELTAGIAHEIQNPLNFVNNFSEVNRELLSELKAEIEKGNIEEVKAIANDIIGNEEKINHHGKRADAIVKGMLQHSRMSSGQKEPTDINALCDEYLRLAYHGLRAKDKSFNAKFETHLDKSIGKISVIPQDIGRVLVNLINNAFYAVNEKQKQASAGVSGGEAASAPNGYAPAVTVTSKKDGDGINLSVSDNGSGIPQKVLDKIFQPFFTTKPSGQGTGLGLSLAYDIIKTHNGDIKVESKEKEGTTFTIHLPETG
jgi:signal transduction histidine kinase